MSQKKKTKPKISKRKSAFNSKVVKNSKKQKNPKGMRNFWFYCPYCDEKATENVKKNEINETDEGHTILNLTCPSCKSKVKLKKLKYGKQWKTVDVTLTPRALRPRIEEIDETVAHLQRRRRG